MNKKYIFLLILIISAFIFYLDKNIFFHVFKSLYRMALGYSLSILLGISLGILLSVNKYVLYAFKPLIKFLMSIPTITWVPILLIFFGLNEITVIIAIFLGSFFTILYNTIDGFENINYNYIKFGRLIYNDNKLSIIIKVLIPASFNQILVGLKLGISYSWRALVGAEMLGAAQNGLGVLLFSSKSFYNIPKMLLVLFIIASLGYIFNKILIEQIENITLKKWGLLNDNIS